MKSAIFQCAGGGLSQEQRLAALEKQLSSNDVALVVCPELFLSGYAVGDKLIALAENLEQGRFRQAISEIAKRYSTAIVYGYPERANDAIYNSAACIDANGEVIANHRKLLLPPGFESDYFSSGTQPTLFELNGLCCAILICYDAEYPEAIRAMAEAGAQLIIVPTALVKNWAVVARRVMPTRAFENGVWLMYANHAGAEGDLNYLGESCIIAPNGQDAARASHDEAFIIAEITADKVLASQQRLPYLQGVKALRQILKDAILHE